MPVTHSFVDGKADGADATIARPSDWNANHSGSPDFSTNLYDPNVDMTIGAGATAIFNTDPLIIDSGRTITIPATGTLWLDAPRTAASSPALTTRVSMVNVLDYGAVGDGVTDDWQAIQNAMDNSQLPIFMPAGHYKITKSLQLPALFSGMYGPGREGIAYIEPSAQTFAAFINRPGDYGGNWTIAYLHISYGPATGYATATDTNACGFQITNATYAPSNYTLSACRIDYAYYGYYDTSVSNLVTLNGVTAQGCNTGFLKNNSTTFMFSNCFANFCGTGWNMNGCISTTFTSCAVQGCTANGMFFTNMHGLTLNGIDFEQNTFAGNNAAGFTLSNCQGFVMNGVRGFGNTYATGGGAVAQYGMYFNSASKGVVTGFTVGSDQSDSGTGAGATVYSIFTDATANQITFIGCDLKAVTSGSGSPTVVMSLTNNTAGNILTFINCNTSGTQTDAGNRNVYLPDVNGSVKLSGSTATVPMLTYPAGTLLTAAAAGVVEYDGTAYYSTNDTTNGRRIDDAWNYFRLTGSGTGITTIADFFGATDGIPLVANGVYEIEWHCYFSQVTAGTATWTIVTATTALANLTGEYIGSPIGGIGAVGTPQTAAINVTSSSSTAFPVTGTEATAVTHYFTIRAMLTAGNGASNTRLRLAMSAGTATPLINSYFRVRRLAGGNVGTYVA